MRSARPSTVDFSAIIAFCGVKHIVFCAVRGFFLFQEHSSSDDDDVIPLDLRLGWIDVHDAFKVAVGENISGGDSECHSSLCI
jgi:hypothetical protein